MNRISKHNHIHTSTGETLTRAEFNRRVSEAKDKKVQEQLNDHGYNFCVDCAAENFEHSDWDGLDYGILDCSHEISVKECIESGRAELAYNTDNIKIRCRAHHRIKDKSNLKFKQHA